MKLKFFPIIFFMFMIIMLIGMTIAASELYAWVPQGYCYGTGCYASGKRPGNFYTAAFSYEDTLVGFIFMMINFLLILVVIIVWIIIFVKKKTKQGHFTFLIVFGAIYFTTGLVMSIFVEACRYIDDAVGMSVCGFLGTFAAIGLIVYAIIAKYKLKKIDQEPAAVTAGAAPSQPQSFWYCPECGTKNYDTFCSECGTKRPDNI